MVGELYDYMIGIVIVGVIFISAVFAVPAISYVNLLQVNQQQLRNTVLNVFNAMLLGTGSPVDWGSIYHNSTLPFNQYDVEAFGLDYSEEFSMYVLDTDKVQRLDNSTPGFIEYEYVRERLGLKDYGFIFTIFRPFTVKTDLEINSTTNDVSFAVDVTRSEDGRPLPNAEVSCTILVASENVNKDIEPIVNITTPETYFTNALGRCEGTQNIDPTPGYEMRSALAILKVTVAGISTTVVKYTDEDAAPVMKISTFGDTIVLSIREEDYDTKAARWVKSITAYNFDSLTTVYERDPKNKTADKFTHGLGWWCWNRTFTGLRAMDPALLLFTIYTAIPGRGFSPVIVAGPFSLYESYEIFSFGPETEQPSDVAIKLRRYVVISGMTYIAELALWKE